MSVLASAHLLRPEDLHEIARLRLIEVVEVSAKPQFVKEAGCARAICVPPAPNSFAIVLISDDELIQRRKIEVELSPRTQGFDCSDKHEIGRSRTETRRGR